jgi:hypothetical protein
MQNGAFTYYQMDGWDVQGFDNFEDDGYYAKTNMENWAGGKGWPADPFVADNYPGSMLP